MILQIYLLKSNKCTQFLTNLQICISKIFQYICQNVKLVHGSPDIIAIFIEPHHA